ncbi:hypothetical protein OH76DRAFT_658566 [Lentinus brumalis]|uniref:Uncharacterized protein n=1 Tax=Lentinus brumalis TaxID=2498619 RepID=A0A371D7N0_9APHY|nr:hypothetical protein OH76DRAFT_658566 [Polyporus brumalis]
MREGENGKRMLCRVLQSRHAAPRLSRTALRGARRRRRSAHLRELASDDWTLEANSHSALTYYSILLQQVTHIQWMCGRFRTLLRPVSAVAPIVVHRSAHQ